MMIRCIFCVILLLNFSEVIGQTAPTKPLLFKWWIELTDKNNSPYSIAHPEMFLSARSIERRERNGCPVLEEDLPVSPAYLKALRDQGFVIHGASRWMNAVAIIADTATAMKAGNLPFVRNIICVGRDIRITNPPNRPQKGRAPVQGIPSVAEKFGPLGYSSVNLEPLSTPFLHAVGAKGAGIWVAVMDGGFTNADTMPFFDSLALHGRLWQGPDFVEHDAAVFESAQHGTSVLSVMGSNLPGYFVGSAPDATYFLLKTEDVGGEFPIEEVNWILGAEWADSIGVDIINASLGYTTFSNPAFNRPYSALDGRSSIGAKGATIAARKGMLIFNSAGNSGDEPWHYIGVPADAPGVVAVGAFDSQSGKHAAFSSYGPTADGRIKPDLSAPGQNVVTAASQGFDLTMSAGTSIAAPILAGSVAALWSAFPERPAQEIIAAVFATAHQSGSPDNLLGYGIPDMSAAWMDLQQLYTSHDGFMLHFDRAKAQLLLLMNKGQVVDNQYFKIKNIFGKTCAEGRFTVSGTLLTLATTSPLPDVPLGAYWLETEQARFFFGK